MIPHLATLRALAATPPDAEEASDPRNETSPLLSPAQRNIVSRLAAAALDLFEERGFDATTIDDIARTAGLNRRTFFRYFPAKEDVLFAHHVDYLYAFDRRLELPGRDPLETARHALEALIDGETEQRELSVRRHRVIAGTLPLRDRETVWLSEYQRRLTEYLTRTAPDSPAASDSLGPEMAAAALVAAVRTLLADWAAVTPSPPAAGTPPAGTAALRRKFAALTTPVARLLTGKADPQEHSEPQEPRPATTLVALFESTLPPAEAAALIRRATTPDPH